MFSTIVKDLYIGKSKLTFKVNDKIIPDTHTIGQFFFRAAMIPIKNSPDYGTFGNFWIHDNQGTFEITLFHPEHKIYVTGVPKGEVLDNFRLEDTVWSSYYEDDMRGYLFQIIPSNVKPKLIINGSD